MGIKPPDLFDRLPSVAELLEKPPVRALVDRWNRSSVASSLRTFLDEFQQDLRRRASEVQLPSIRELAERAARYVVNQQHESSGAAINATGQLWSKTWSGVPLANAAIDRLAAVAHEFTIDQAATDAASGAIEAALCRLSGAQAAALVHGYSVAMWLALDTLAGEREVLIARAEVGDIGPGEPLPKLAASARVRLRDVGTTNRVSLADYEAALGDQSAAILTLSSDEYEVVGSTGAVRIEELAALARRQGIASISGMGASPLVPAPSSLQVAHGSVQQAIEAGVGLVVVRGEGMLGGPACGIVLGQRDLVGEITRHSLFPACRLDTLRAAALMATLEQYSMGEHGYEALPVWQLLETPVENLRNRAERIAPQLAAADLIDTATAVELRSSLTAAMSGSMTSYGLALVARTGSATDLEQRLRELPYPVYGRVEGDRVLLDLRTVLPRQDRALVEAIGGPGEQVGENPSYATVDHSET